MLTTQAMEILHDTLLADYGGGAAYIVYRPGIMHDFEALRGQVEIRRTFTIEPPVFEVGLVEPKVEEDLYL